MVKVASVSRPAGARRAGRAVRTGCYELRHGTLLLFPGYGFNVAKRMTSILPRPPWSWSA